MRGSSRVHSIIWLVQFPLSGIGVYSWKHSHQRPLPPIVAPQVNLNQFPSWNTCLTACTLRKLVARYAPTSWKWPSTCSTLTVERVISLLTQVAGTSRWSRQSSQFLGGSWWDLSSLGCWITSVELSLTAATKGSWGTLKTGTFRCTVNLWFCQGKHSIVLWHVVSVSMVVFVSNAVSVLLWMVLNSQPFWWSYFFHFCIMGNSSR